MRGAYMGAFLAHYITITVQLLLFAGVMLLAGYDVSQPPF